MTATNTDNSDGGNDTKADIAATTDKITGFFSDKIEDTKYQLEARQRKFAISGAGSKLDRKKAKVKNWFDKEVVARAEETKDGFQKMTGKDTQHDQGKNRNENEFRKVGEADVDDGCGGSIDFDCSNPCGVFSTS